MTGLMLVFSKPEHEAAWLDIVSEFESAGERVKPYALKYGTQDFKDYLRKASGFHNNIEMPPGRVPSSIYFLMREGEDKILGAVDIRHYLNEELLFVNGNIGYGIRPSERRKGYATRMLAMALEKCRILGLDRVLVTCNKDNIASARVILNNGGLLANEVVEDNGNVVQRYWIKVLD